MHLNTNAIFLVMCSSVECLAEKTFKTDYGRRKSLLHRCIAPLVEFLLVQKLDLLWKHITSETSFQLITIIDMDYMLVFLPLSFKNRICIRDMRRQGSGH